MVCLGFKPQGFRMVGADRPTDLLRLPYDARKSHHFPQQIDRLKIDSLTKWRCSQSVSQCAAHLVFSGAANSGRKRELELIKFGLFILHFLNPI